MFVKKFEFVVKKYCTDEFKIKSVCVCVVVFIVPKKKNTVKLDYDAFNEKNSDSDSQILANSVCMRQLILSKKIRGKRRHIKRFRTDFVDVVRPQIEAEGISALNIGHNCRLDIRYPHLQSISI